MMSARRLAALATVPAIIATQAAHAEPVAPVRVFCESSFVQLTGYPGGTFTITLDGAILLTGPMVNGAKIVESTFAANPAGHTLHVTVTGAATPFDQTVQGACPYVGPPTIPANIPAQSVAPGPVAAPTVPAPSATPAAPASSAPAQPQPAATSQPQTASGQAVPGAATPTQPAGTIAPATPTAPAQTGSEAQPRQIVQPANLAAATQHATAEHAHRSRALAWALVAGLIWLVLALPVWAIAGPGAKLRDKRH